MQHEYNVAVKLESKPMPPPTKKLTVCNTFINNNQIPRSIEIKLVGLSLSNKKIEVLSKKLNNSLQTKQHFRNR
jgi:hypothetical protein